MGPDWQCAAGARRADTFTLAAGRDGNFTFGAVGAFGAVGTVGTVGTFGTFGWGG